MKEPHEKYTSSKSPLFEQATLFERVSTHLVILTYPLCTGVQNLFCSFLFLISVVLVILTSLRFKKFFFRKRPVQTSNKNCKQMVFCRRNLSLKFLQQQSKDDINDICRGRKAGGLRRLKLCAHPHHFSQTLLSSIATLSNLWHQSLFLPVTSFLNGPYRQIYKCYATFCDITETVINIIYLLLNLKIQKYFLTNVLLE